jgi:hypothetical protein
VPRVGLVAGGRTSLRVKVPEKAPEAGLATREKAVALGGVVTGAATVKTLLGLRESRAGRRSALGEGAGGEGGGGLGAGGA